MQSTQKVTSSRVTCLQHLSVCLLAMCRSAVWHASSRYGAVRTVLERKPQALRSRAVAVQTLPHVVETRREKKGRGLFPLRDIQAKRERANFPVRPSKSHPMTMDRWRVRLAAHIGSKIVGMASQKVRERPSR